ncbi:MAG: hypothetical protein OXK80_01810 [Bdellovibrionales bacterium]|nr:hypothetical protein [Bdellovibrionales bacterium]
MLDKYLNKLYFDKRMIHWGLSQGVISQQDVQKHLSELEDVSDKADVIQPSSKEDTENTD